MIEVSVNAAREGGWEEIWTGTWPALLPAGSTFEVRQDPGEVAPRYFRVLGYHLVMFAAERFATSCVVWAQEIPVEEAEPLDCLPHDAG